MSEQSKADPAGPVGTCIECGDELPGERLRLGYRYCTRPGCQARHHRGTVVTAIGNNKSADMLVVADPDEIARRGEAGEFARKDTGLGIDYRTPGTAPSRDGEQRQPAVPAPRRPAPGRPAPGRAAQGRPTAGPRWNADQEKVVRLYHDMGLAPSQIAARAARNNPRLGITERLVVQILSSPRR